MMNPRPLTTRDGKLRYISLKFDEGEGHKEAMVILRRHGFRPSILTYRDKGRCSGPVNHSVCCYWPIVSEADDQRRVDYLRENWGDHLRPF